jgi:hypothetical protein
MRICNEQLQSKTGLEGKTASALDFDLILAKLPIDDESIASLSAVSDRLLRVACDP